MKRKYKEITKDTVISVRISDDEMLNVKQLMGVTSLSASEIMRRAFHLQVERFNQTATMINAAL